MEVPLSEIDPNDVASFIEDEKTKLKNVDTDVKDAKRRISSVKPRAKKAPVKPADSDSESD